MSISTELTTLSTNITNAYNAIQTKGGTIPTNKNTENLETAINSISSYENPLRDIISNRSSMTTVDFPSGITSIDIYAFCGCTSLKDVTLPKSLKTIKSRAFSECSSLKQISIPNSVETLEDGIFKGSPVKVTLPKILQDKIIDKFLHENSKTIEIF